MPKSSNSKQSPALSEAGTSSVDALATRALSLVATKKSKSDRFDQAAADLLHDAAADLITDTVPEAAAEMLSRGISAEMIADVYIPHVARQMGDEWCDDQLSFARVTIGAARLQSLLRSLGERWCSDANQDNAGARSAVVVIVAQNVFHTLGALVLSGQLRRMGLSVRLSIGSTPVELRAICQSVDFNAAFISATCGERLDSLREIVEIIKESRPERTPVVIGGNVLDIDEDIAALTGADLVTNDPVEALKHCGLTSMNQTIPVAQEQGL